VRPPANKAFLTVADVEACVRCRVRLSYGPLPAYQAFRSKRLGRAMSGSAMQVEVRTEEAPPDDSPAVFDTEGAWYLQAEGDGYRISLRGGAREAPRLVACADVDTSHVTVYVGSNAGPAADEGERRRRAPAGERGAQTLVNPMSYPLDQLLLMNHLASRGGVIVHAAGAVVNHRALLLAGASGAGKSTICRLLTDAGLGDSLLSDDRVIVRTAGGGRPASNAASGSESGPGTAVAWGTPWAGEAMVARNASAPVGALLFLVKADNNRLARIGVAETLGRLTPLVSCPWYDAGRLGGVLDTCGRIAQQTPCYELHFRPDAGVVDLLATTPWGS